MTLIHSISVFCEDGDGVIFDENGLTIKVGENPRVDSNR